MSEEIAPPDPRRLKVFADQTRVQILQRLDHRLASAPELAIELRLSQCQINYHLKVLSECGCVEVAAVRKRQGKDTQFFTAKPGVLPPSSGANAALEAKPVDKTALRVFACKAESAFDAGVAEDSETSTFTIETLRLTTPHRLTAIEALRLTVANLRMLHEQSRHLGIATDAPLISVEVGVAMFEPLNDSK